jgi:hypothetical protein
MPHSAELIGASADQRRGQNGKYGPNRANIWRVATSLVQHFMVRREGAQGPWLLPRNDCCWVATLSEDLTVIQASSCARRFLATPLDEIIPS